ncbi:MAG: hypothetical protein OQK54_02285 [Gammaproteobacteria bacterium]|nr:hypothetical protein [Gammaproteobacteria bacterium]
MKYLLPILIPLLLLSACLSPGTSTQGDPISVWSLQLELSGGIAGIHRSLQLDHSGQLMAIDHRNGREVTRTLDNAQMARVEALLQALPYSPVQSSDDKRPLPGERCADCIVSRLQLTMDGVQHQNIHQTPSATSPYEALRKHLAGLLQQALAQAD